MCIWLDLFEILSSSSIVRQKNILKTRVSHEVKR